MPKAIRIAAILLLVLAAILAVLAFGIARRSTPAAEVAAARVTAPAPVPPRRVVVAAHVLPAGQPIEAADLSTTEMAVRPSEGFTNISDLVGRVPIDSIAAGVLIGPSHLLQGIAVGLKPGERAVSVPVDELAGVSNRVAPGDFVDVFMSLQAPSNGGSQNQNPQARLLLSRLRVLGYGGDDVGKQQAAAAAAETQSNAASGQPEPGSRAETIASRDNGSSGTGQANAPARSAILAVPVEDAGRLLLAAHNGRLFLALRNPGDTGLADASLFAAPAPVLALRRNLDAASADAANRPENQAYAGISLSGLAGDDNRPAAANAAPAPQRQRVSRPANRNSIEIIRGNTPSNRLSSP